MSLDPLVGGCLFPHDKPVDGQLADGELFDPAASNREAADGYGSDGERADGSGADRQSDECNTKPAQSLGFSEAAHDAILAPPLGGS